MRFHAGANAVVLGRGFYDFREGGVRFIMADTFEVIQEDLPFDLNLEGVCDVLEHAAAALTEIGARRLDTMFGRS